MADVIKIPYGYVIAASSHEWAMLAAAVKTMVEAFNDDILTEEERVGKGELEKLLFDLISPKSDYGSGGVPN